MRAAEHTARNPESTFGDLVLDSLRALFHPSLGPARSRTLSSAVALGLTALGLVYAAPASAAQQYSFLGTHQSCGTIDSSNGDHYEDTGTAVNVFDSSCSPLATWTGAATPAGGFLGNFEEKGLAIDESTNLADPHAGDIYVWDPRSHAIDVFDPGPAEHYLCQVTGAGSASTSASECDTSAPGVPGGSFDNNETQVRIFAPIIDPASGDFYVNRNTRLPSQDFEAHAYKFSAAGRYLGEIVLPQSLEPGRNAANVSVVDTHSGVLFAGANLFSAASGEYLETWDGSPAVNPPGTPTGEIFRGGPIVDQVTGDVYFQEGNLGLQIFGPEGHYFDTIPGALPGARPGSLVFQYTQINQSNHHIYVGGIILPETPVLVPDTAAKAPTLHAFAATLNGTVNPDGQAITNCRFEYTTEAEFKAGWFEAAKTVPCAEAPAQIGEENSPVAVHAEIGCPNPEVEVPEGKCLKPESLYQFRLVAANSNESPNPTSYGSYSEPQQLETLPIPVIDSGAATTPTPTSADLSATVNPKGHDTTCQVEWGQTEEPYNPAIPYQHTEPCQPSDLGAGFADVSAALHLEGLTAGLTYHWRLTVASVAATVHGPDHTFVYLRPQQEEVDQSCENQVLRTENSSLSLPDCRAYEAVTPARKNGATIGRGVVIRPTEPAASGERVIGMSLTAFGDAGAQNAQRPLSEADPFLFSRTASGWLTTPLAPPATLVSSNASAAISAESGAAMFIGQSSPQGPDDAYLRSPDGSLLDLGPLTPPEDGPTLKQTEIEASISPDASHVIWQARPSGTITTLYEYAESFSEPLLVAVSGGQGSSELIDRCGTTGNRISEDNRTIYFTAEKCNAGGTGANAGHKIPASQLYARLDGEGPGAETVLISAPSPTGCDAGCQASAPGDAQFQNASPDGSRVLFTSAQRLLDSATEGSQNLYLYDFSRPSGERLTDLSAGDTSGQGPGVQTVVTGFSVPVEVGPYVYFVASGVLAANPGAAVDQETGRPQHAEVGADNLYVYEHDAAHPAGQVSFIAALSGEDTSRITLTTSTHNDDTSADGRYLVFVSDRPLTADDSGPEGHGYAGRSRVYRYDAASAKLLRVSVGERGFNDNGNTEPAHAALAIYRSISADGSRVFFTSPAGLVPGALDMVQTGFVFPGEPAYAQNVYEWHQGEVRLISDGTDAATEGGISIVRLLGASASGRDVFFQTADPLAASDTDTSIDIYDARSGGGFPRPVEPELCLTADACHTGSTAEAANPSPATATFNGLEEGPNHPQKPPKHHGRKKKHSKKHHRAKHQRAANSDYGGPR